MTRNVNEYLSRSLIEELRQTWSEKGRQDAPFCGDFREQLRELLDLSGYLTKIELGREEACHLQQEQPRECGRDEVVVASVTESCAIILRSKEDGKAVRRGLLSLKRELALFKRHLFPGDSTESDADKP
jgi:hypothetical protein